MKKTTWMFAGFALVMSLAPSLRAETTEMTGEINRHNALAAAYTQKAAAEEALIAEHEQMKAEALKHGVFNAKVGPSLDYRAMELHCDKLIQSAKEVKNELGEFEKYHKMRISELQGQ